MLASPTHPGIVKTLTTVTGWTNYSSIIHNPSLWLCYHQVGAIRNFKCIQTAGINPVLFVFSKHCSGLDLS